MIDGQIPKLLGIDQKIFDKQKFMLWIDRFFIFKGFRKYLQESAGKWVK